MTIRRPHRLLSCFVLTALLSASGCATGRNADRGTLLGATFGSILGGIIGHQTGHTVDGAMLGAVAGGVTGNVVGEAKDEREYRESMAHYEQLAQQQRMDAVTNAELVMMVRNGISDDVIISTVKTRGARIDLSPAAIINLKNSGVSDAVILGVQEAARSSTPTPTVVAPSRVESSIVVVRPAPVIGVGYSIGRPYPYRRPPQRHVHYHF